MLFSILIIVGGILVTAITILILNYNVNFHSRHRNHIPKQHGNSGQISFVKRCVQLSGMLN